MLGQWAQKNIESCPRLKGKGTKRKVTLKISKRKDAGKIISKKKKKELDCHQIVTKRLGCFIWYEGIYKCKPKWLLQATLVEMEETTFGQKDCIFLVYKWNCKNKVIKWSVSLFTN